MTEKYNTNSGANQSIIIIQQSNTKGEDYTTSQTIMGINHTQYYIGHL